MEYGKIYDKEGQEIKGAQLYLGFGGGNSEFFFGDKAVIGKDVVTLIGMDYFGRFAYLKDRGNVMGVVETVHPKDVFKPKKKRRMTWREALRHLDEVCGKFVLGKTLHQDLSIDIANLQNKLPPEYKFTRDYGITIEDFPEVDE